MQVAVQRKFNRKIFRLRIPRPSCTLLPCTQSNKHPCSRRSTPRPYSDAVTAGPIIPLPLPIISHLPTPSHPAPTPAAPFRTTVRLYRTFATQGLQRLSFRRCFGGHVRAPTAPTSQKLVRYVSVPLSAGVPCAAVHSRNPICFVLASFPPENCFRRAHHECYI